MKILIDNGHGENTPGKCSPDKRLREYKWARECAELLCAKLKNMGYDAERIVTEEWDVPLSERCKRVNSICKKHGSKNCLLVSIHNNAAGADGKWHTAKGWSVFVSKNASARSKILAECLLNQVKIAGVEYRVPAPNQSYWVQNLAICRDTNCAAVLTENLFQDNKEDVDYLLSDAGMSLLVDLHAKGIAAYIKTIGG